VQASQASPHTHPGLQHISTAVVEAWPADAGDQHDRTEQSWSKGGADPSVDTPRTWPRPNAPKPLQRAIPTLAGVVLVVNARMGEQQRPAPLTGGLLGRLQPGRAA
jgi:hypothetical protein